MSPTSRQRGQSEGLQLVCSSARVVALALVVPVMSLSALPGRCRRRRRGRNIVVTVAVAGLEVKDRRHVAIVVAIVSRREDGAAALVVAKNLYGRRSKRPAPARDTTAHLAPIAGFALPLLLPSLVLRQRLVLDVGLGDGAFLPVSEPPGLLVGRTGLGEGPLGCDGVQVVRLARLGVEDDLVAGPAEAGHGLLADAHFELTLRDMLGLGQRGLVEGVVGTSDGDEFVIGIVVFARPVGLVDEIGEVRCEDVLVGALEHAVVLGLGRLGVRLHLCTAVVAPPD